MSDSIIHIEGLKKTYASGHTALSGVTLSVERGDFFALLGPNGAGKTTLINVLTGLVEKSEGTVVIDGMSLDDNAPRARMSIGVVPQEFNFGYFERVIDIVVNQAGYYGVPRHVALPKATDYLTRLGLGDKLTVQARTLSGGMKRRLMIARALVHEPKLLILDEPTAGVDLELRRGMWEFLTELNQEGVTILLTTHYLEEAEALCRSVAILNKGEIVAEGNMRTLLASMDEESYIFDLSTPVTPALVDLLAIHRARRVDEHAIELVATRTHGVLGLLTTLSESGVEVRSLKNSSNRLEQFFISQTVA
jgi:ABC-2 type transport system ATP-binding protein